MVGTIVGTAMAVKDLVNTYNEYSKGEQTPETVLELGKSLGKKINSKMRHIGLDGNMGKVLNKTTIEPLIIITKDALRENSVSQKVMELGMEVFASYYLQVFDLLRYQEGIQDVNSVLTLLSTDGSSETSALIDLAVKEGLDRYGVQAAEFAVKSADWIGRTFGKESLSLKLGVESFPAPSAVNLAREHFNKQSLKISFESIEDDLKESQLEKIQLEIEKLQNDLTSKKNKYEEELIKERIKEAKERVKQIENMNDQQFKEFQEREKSRELYVNPNKITGNINEELLSSILIKNIKVTITFNSGKDHNGKDVVLVVDIPIRIKARIIVVSQEDIANMVRPFTKEKGFLSRIEDWMSGAITGKDLFLCGDLIKEMKDIRLKDKNKLINVLEARTSSANSRMISGVNDGRGNTVHMAGFEKYYNIFIITENNKKYIEKIYKEKLASSTNHINFLNKIGGLSLCILDTDEEMIEMSIQGSGHSVVSYKALNRRKGDSSELTDILKAVLSSRPII